MRIENQNRDLATIFVALMHPKSHGTITLNQRFKVDSKV